VAGRHPSECDLHQRKHVAIRRHRIGDGRVHRRIHCVVGEKTINGTWMRIDEDGRAVLNTSEGAVAVSAGDLILA
jgi:hypothetical protein